MRVADHDDPFAAAPIVQGPWGEPATNPRDARDATLPLVWFKDIMPHLTGNWLVKKVVPSEAFMTIIGHPGCGKSFLALDIALHVASEREWMGRRVKPGLVVYLAAEGQRGQFNRIEAWKRHHRIAGNLPFAMIPVAVNLRDKKADLPNLIRTIEAAVALSGMQLAMLIIDTLDRTFGGGDENGEDMGDYITNSQRVRAHFGCTTITVHHVPKNCEILIERGHGSLRGAIEASLAVSYDETTKIRTIRCTKMKDGEDGWEMAFRLESIDLGVDEDGDAVTSCVLAPVDLDDDALAASARSKGPSLSPTDRSVYQELIATIGAAGLPVPKDIPADKIDSMVVRVVSYRTWRDRWIAVAASDKEPDTARRTFDRAALSLSNKGLIARWGDHAWCRQ